jgi:hypothetical protein
MWRFCRRSRTTKTANLRADARAVTAHHPLEFEHHRQRHADRRRLEHYPPRTARLRGALAMGGIVGSKQQADRFEHFDYMSPARKLSQKYSISE